MTTERSYRILLSPDADGDWIAEIPELDGCITHGGTPEEALESLKDAQQQWIAAAMEAGWDLPEQCREAGEYSGKFTLRIPKSLHRHLANMAFLEGVSLNQYVLHLLSAGSAGHYSVESRFMASVEVCAISDTTRRSWLATLEDHPTGLLAGPFGVPNTLQLRRRM